MSYAFTAAFHQYGLRKGPALAFLTHMAEGHGTVGYLSRQNPNGVSVHFVIESSGRIVQMLSLDAASGSVNPQLIRQDDDTDGFFGATAARAVLGDWHRDPNSAVISVEIEGFASLGPNVAQRQALAELAGYVRSQLPSIRGNLGHRDFARYKACPGRLIPWSSIGGHGLYREAPVTVNPNLHKPSLLCDVASSTVYAKLEGPEQLIPAWAGGKGIFLFAEAKVAKTSDGKATRVPILLDMAGGPAEDLRIGWVGTDVVSNVRSATPPPVDTTPYSQGDLDNAVETFRERVRTASLAVLGQTIDSTPR